MHKIFQMIFKDLLIWLCIEDLLGNRRKNAITNYLFPANFVQFEIYSFSHHTSSLEDDPPISFAVFAQL